MPTRPLSIGGVAGTAEDEGGDSFWRMTCDGERPRSPFAPDAHMMNFRPPAPVLGAVALLGGAAAGWSAATRRARRRTATVHRTMVQLLLNTLCAGDPGTARHSRRVAALTDVVGRSYRLDREGRARLRVGALLHDLGKLDGDINALVHSDRQLTGGERSRMEQHSDQSADILEPLERIHPGIAEIVQAHHERWDGAGYPRGIAGTLIPLESRIIAVADVFDAMTQPRSYHDAAEPHEVLRVLREEAGKSFDPEVVDRLDRPEIWSEWVEIALAGRRQEAHPGSSG